MPSWYYPKSERMTAVQAEIDAAAQALQSAQDNLDLIKKNAGSSQFLSIEEKLSSARSAYETAQAVLDQTAQDSAAKELRDAAQNSFDLAKNNLDDAQKAYDDAVTTAGAQDILKARAKVTIAQQRLYAAQNALAALQTGSQSLAFQSVANSVDQAKASQLQAEAAVQQAQANLDMIHTQIDQLTITAPIDGMVLTSSVQPGEILPAGTTGLSLARLDQLTLTVYIPESQYGQINLGEQASLKVDSYPGETFAAAVTRIANQAEFTPRNVQTADERQTTVYAIEFENRQQRWQTQTGHARRRDFPAVAAV